MIFLYLNRLKINLKNKTNRIIKNTPIVPAIERYKGWGYATWFISNETKKVIIINLAPFLS